MLHSGQWKRIFWLVQTISFFLSSGDVFFNKSFIPAIGGFSLQQKPSTLLERSLLLVETVNDMSGNLFLPLSQIFFKEFFIPASETHLSVQKKKYCFLVRTFFPAGENYLNYREAYLRLLSLLLATIFLDLSDIPANVSIIFVQQKRILKQILHSCQWKPIFCLFETIYSFTWRFFFLSGNPRGNPIFEK